MPPTHGSRERLLGVWLGQRPYAAVLQLQQSLAAQRRQGLGSDCVLFVEHPPTITLGRGSKLAHLLAPETRLQELGIECHSINRGGDITLHAPGQLVGYPILALREGQRDVRRYVQMLVQTMAQVALDSGIRSGPVEGYVGLWVDRAKPEVWSGPESALELAKLGAIGVALSRWVTSHGFALNLSTDLELFRLIVPCGIAEHPVTSIQQLTGSAPSLRDTAPRAHSALASLLQREPAWLDASSGSLQALLQSLAPAPATQPHQR
jgi:lipoyl(octanoyl) transferase